MARPVPAQRLRYIGVGEALLRVLRELGGEAEVNRLLVETWKRFVENPRGEAVTMRLFIHPSGRAWSPEAEEALHALQVLGVIERRDGLVRLRRTA